MIAFTVVIETVFAYPGMGKLLIESSTPRSAGGRRLPYGHTVIFVVINLIVDSCKSRLIRASGSAARRVSHERNRPPTTRTCRPSPRVSGCCCGRCAILCRALKPRSDLCPDHAGRNRASRTAGLRRKTRMI